MVSWASRFLTRRPAPASLAAGEVAGRTGYPGGTTRNFRSAPWGC